MKRRIVLLSFLCICSCKSKKKDEFTSFAFAVTVDNKGSNPVQLSIWSKGGDENVCKNQADSRDNLIPAGTKASYTAKIDCWYKPVGRYTSFTRQKTLSEKARALTIAYVDLSGQISENLSPGLDVTWRINDVSTNINSKTTTDPWVNAGQLSAADLPVSFTQPEVESIEKSPVRFTGKHLEVLLSGEAKTVDIGIKANGSTDFTYHRATVDSRSDSEGFIEAIDAPLQVICDDEQCAASLVK